MFCGLSLFAQNEEPNTNETTTDDSIVYKERYGLRVGLDISKIIRSFAQDDYTGVEIVGDYRLNKKWYAAAEIGREERTSDEDYYNYTTTGNYIKLGADWNGFNNWYGMENMIGIGFRYAFSTFSQNVHSYSPSTSDPYWGEYGTSGINPDIIREYSSLSAHWLEFSIFMKVEVMRNVYIGGSARLSSMVADKAGDNFPNLWVPGFNKVTDGSSFGMNYNYSISYLIPFKNKTKKSKIQDTEEDKPGLNE